jgi:DNA-binding NarL/FixJ family response regulator
MKHGRVLLADRHQNMLKSIRGLLETVFDVVLMVSDEKSLLDALDKVKPDLVVVDLSLPVSEEVNVVRRIKKHSPDMRVIILSIHDEQAAVEECMSAGAEGFVLKRSAGNDMIPAVWEVFRGNTYISPSVDADA